MDILNFIRTAPAEAIAVLLLGLIVGFGAGFRLKRFWMEERCSRLEEEKKRFKGKYDDLLEDFKDLEQEHSRCLEDENQEKDPAKKAGGNAGKVLPLKPDGISPQEPEKNVVVVAAKVAWDTYQKYHAYICQAERSFGQAKYLAFYAKGEIQAAVPEILEKHDKVMLERGKYPGNLGETVNKMLDIASKEVGDKEWQVGGIQQFATGDVVQVVLLTNPDDPRTVKLAQSVKSDKKGKSGKNVAFTMWQRYVSLSKLKQAKTTNELE